MVQSKHRSLAALSLALALVASTALAGAQPQSSAQTAAQSAAQPPASGPAAPADLRCEYLQNPMGVDVRAPRFFWTLDHSERGQRQAACQVIVSTDPAAAAGDAWDSGKVASPASIQVA